jgi:hypothetical protein
MKPRLRIFNGDEDQLNEPQRVTVPLGELATVLGEASRWDRTWVRDFANDDVQVSSDLYEILSTYWQLRPSA